PLPLQAGWLDLAIGAASAPFRVEAGESHLDLTLYTAREIAPDPLPAGIDPLLGGIEWARLGPGAIRARIRLSRPLWGYKAFYTEGGDLVLRLRRPPGIEVMSPLRGRRIVVDPGHPPAGATGPTGLTEAEANLGVSLVLRDLLTDAGATVLMTRTTDVPVELGARPRFAEEANAHLLISIHNNALPDGVNPLTNNGTSVFYNHPRSIPLAAAVQRALVSELGLRDLGVGRGDLALVRPTWFPAILTEGLFMMVPEQEAALRTEEG